MIKWTIKAKSNMRVTLNSALTAFDAVIIIIVNDCGGYSSLAEWAPTVMRGFSSEIIYNLYDMCNDSDMWCHIGISTIKYIRHDFFTESVKISLAMFFCVVTCIFGFSYIHPLVAGTEINHLTLPEWMELVSIHLLLAIHAKFVYNKNNLKVCFK